MTFKGVRRREGDMLHWISVLGSHHWISVLASLRHLVLEYAGLRHLVLGYENAKHSYVYKTIAKKTCAPKTRATLAMPWWRMAYLDVSLTNFSTFLFF